MAPARGEARGLAALPNLRLMLASGVDPKLIRRWTSSSRERCRSVSSVISLRWKRKLQHNQPWLQGATRARRFSPLRLSY